MTTISPNNDSGDNCLQIKVPIDDGSWDVDTTWIIIAALIGFLIGALIALFCACLCLKDKYRKEYGNEYYQDDEIRYTPHIAKQYDSTTALINKNSTPKKKLKKKKKAGIKRRTKGDNAEFGDYDPLAPVIPINLTIPDGGEFSDLTRGLGFAMMQNNGEAMDAELANQDLQAVEEMELEFKEENLNTMVQMLRVLLMRQMASQKIPEEEMKALMTDMQNNLTDLIDKNQKDYQADEQLIMQKHKNNIQQQEEELEKLHPKYTQSLNVAIQSEKDRIRRELGKNSDLNQDEVDALMVEFSSNMAKLERKQMDDRAKTEAALEERLAKRKQKIELYQNNQQQQRDEIQGRRDMHDHNLTDIVNDGKLNEKQKQEILDEYENNLRKTQMQHEEELKRQKLKLSEKLEKQRRKRAEELADQQKQEREEFSKKSENAKSGEALVNEYHNLLQVQREERQQLEGELDKAESNKIEDLTEKMASERLKKLDENERHLYEALQNNGLNDNEAAIIMQRHDDDMENYERQQDQERNLMKNKLQRRLEERKMRAAKKSAEAMSTEEQVNEQQDSTIHKVLASQIELDKEIKDKILQEHDQQMVSVNNQIQMSRLRQQKQMEKKLADRRAKIGEIKEKQEQAKLLKTKEREKELSKLQQQLDNEIDQIHKEKQSRTESLKARLADETRQAIAEQEKQMSALIGRLQAGAARRQAIIKKNEQKLSKLEDGFTNKIEEKVEDEQVDERQVNKVLEQHYNQINDLQDRMNENKARQDAALKERIEAKKLKKQRNLEKNIDREASEEHHRQQQINTGIATSILTQSFMDQKHKMLMDQLEKEMHVEMIKQREELNKELDAEIKEELDEQRKNFLGQLAAISNISKDEMKDIVGDAVYDTGGNQQEAKALYKEMRAKSAVGRNRGHADNYN